MQKLSFIILTLALAACTALAQSNPTSPTLRIVTEDPTLPSQLYYGNIKVKPLLIRPGTNQPITISDKDFFVQQQYIDFLSRFPDADGFAAWLGVLNRCANAEAPPAPAMDCDKIAVSASFFLSPEFREKGYFIYRYYKATIGRMPLYTEIIPDMRAVTGQTGDERIAKQNQFADSWINRSEFSGKYNGLSGQAFIDKLKQTAELTAFAGEAQLVNDLNSGAKTKAQAVRAFIESPEVAAKYYNEAFVAMQYFGYLRRDPEPEGFAAWLRVINANPADYRTMVWGFLYSTEYKNRF